MDKREGGRFFLPEALAIPYEGIDEQHRGLVDRLNEMRILIASGNPGIAHCHADFLAALAAHFAHEETLMQALGYPHLAKHRADHAAIRAGAEALVRCGAPETPARLYDLLIDDVLRADLPFKAFLAGLGLTEG